MGKLLYQATCCAAIVLMIIVVIVATSTLWFPQHPQVAIIGSGPAGLLMALELCDRGYRKITVYGKLEDSQVQSKEYDGYRINIGALGTMRYGRDVPEVLQLAQRFGMRPKTVVNNPNYTKPDAVTTIPKATDLPLKTIRHNFHRSLSEWALANDVSLNLLTNKQMLLYELMGYGPLTSVPLHRTSSGLLWSLSGDTNLYVLDIDALMKAIRGYLKVKGVKFVSTYVKSVEEKEVRLTDNTTAKADQIIVACDPRSVTHPLSQLFTPHTVTHTDYFSAVYRINGPIPPSNMVMNDVLMTGAKDLAAGYIVITNLNKSGEAVRHLVAYGYANADTTKATILQSVQTQLQTLLPDNTVIPREAFKWEYNVRYTKEAVQNQVPRHVGSMQGQKNIWYTGGMFSHWDISSIANFNSVLAEYVILASMKRPVTP
jgi:phytoene dehydrogenase-like protein